MPQYRNFQAATLRLARSTQDLERIQEAAALCLGVQGAPIAELEFVGILRIAIAA